MFQMLKTWFSRLVDFGDAVVEGLRQAGVPEEKLEDVAAKFVASPSQLAKATADALVFGQEFMRPSEAKIVKSLRLTRKLETTEAAIAAGNYGAGHAPFISSETYPMRAEMQDETALAFLDFSGWDHDPSTAEVHAEMDRLLGHHEIFYEDALRCGAEHPSEQYERPFVFLHEPGEGGSVLYLGGWDGGRGLDRRCAFPAGRWPRHCLFPVRRNKRA